jgi:hypothetical protein
MWLAPSSLTTRMRMISSKAMKRKNLGTAAGDQDLGKSQKWVGLRVGIESSLLVS